MFTTYQKRVSFDSLGQNREFDTDNPLHIPPQYYAHPKNVSTTQAGGSFSSNKRQLDLNFGFDSATPKLTDMDQLFNSFNAIGQGSNYAYSASPFGGTNSSYKRKKIPKLPPPPKKSILKNYEIDATAPITVKLDAPRKKSIVDMTTEELLAMDSQFRSGVQLEKLKFDGDGYLPFMNSGTIDSSTTSATRRGSFGATKKIKNIDTLMIKKKSAKDTASFCSYSAVFKHNGMDAFLKQHFQYVDQEEVHPDNIKKTKTNIDHSSKVMPECLRCVMIYISGRKHTWDALDYALKNYVCDGDQLIVVCHIPEDEEDEDEVTLQAKHAIDNISFYIFRMIEVLKKKDLCISIKIELIRATSVKTVLKTAVQFYKPQLMLLSSLLSSLNLRFARRNMKLPIYAMENLNLPTLVVPCLLMKEIDHQVDNDDDDDDEDVLDPQTRVNNAIDSLDKDKDFDPYSRPQLRNRRKVWYKLPDSVLPPPPLRVTAAAVQPSNNSTPRIKFSDNLEVPKASSSTGHPSSSSSTRRNSTGIYKVRSLFDDDDNPSPPPAIARAKSATGPLAITPTTSNDGIRRKLSAQSAASSSGSTKSSSKRGLFSMFRKKK